MVGVARAFAPENDLLYGPTRSELVQNDRTYTKEEVLALAKEFAKNDKVLYYSMAKIMACESGLKNVQSSVEKGGIRELSFGVAQINLPSHPDITQQQALDVKFSVWFLGTEIQAGRIWKWYGYNPQKDVCTNGLDWRKMVQL